MNAPGEIFAGGNQKRLSGANMASMTRTQSDSGAQRTRPGRRETWRIWACRSRCQPLWILVGDERVAADAAEGRRS